MENPGLALEKEILQRVRILGVRVSALRREGPGDAYKTLCEG